MLLGPSASHPETAHKYEAMSKSIFISMLATAVFFAGSGCSSNPVTGANVAYCEENPRYEKCPSILRKAKEQGIDADPQALVQIREQSQAQDKVSMAENDAYSTRRVGRVVDVQVVSHGTPGSNAGAALGSATAQAGYIDNTILGSGNYSAMGQVGAGVIGAVIGSALDQPARAWYAIHYWIDFGGGPRKIAVSSYSPTHAPRGACVAAHQGQVTVTSTAECDS